MMKVFFAVLIPIITGGSTPQPSMPKVNCDVASLRQNHVESDFTVIHAKFKSDGVYFLVDNKQKTIRCIEFNDQAQGEVSNDLHLGGEASDIKMLLKIEGEIDFEQNRKVTPSVLDAVKKLMRFKQGQAFVFNGQKMKIEIASKKYFYAARIE